MNDVLFTPIRLSELEILIQNSVERALESNNPTPVPIPKYLTVNGLLGLIEEETGKRPAKQTIYGLVSNRKIPFDKPIGRRELRFSRKKIIEWLNNGRQMNHLKEG